MKKAADFRKDAREALSGQWAGAVGTTLAAALLGADITMSGGGSIASSVANQSQNFNQFTENIPSSMMMYLMAVVIAAGAVLSIIGIIQFIIGAFVSLGLIQYNMNLIDGKEARFQDLFSRSSLLGKALWLRLRMSIFTFLWTLLLIIPGIIKSYSYSMSGFIMAENPEIDAGEAMRISTEMMKGNKWRLFCLEFSFIGWALLSILTMGIGFLWLTPYTNAAVSAFYDEVSRNFEE